MADEILKRDQNSAVVLGGVTDDVSQNIRMLRVDPVTNRLLVSSSGGSGASLTATYVGFGSPTNTLTGEAEFNYDSTWNALTIGTAVRPLTNCRLWIDGFGDMIDFGSYPNDFGVLGRQIVNNEMGFLTGNDEYVAVRTNGFGSNMAYGNAGTIQITSIKDGKLDLVGIGTANPTTKLHVVSPSSQVGTGNVTCDTEGNVSGTGTSFTTELSVGDIIVATDESTSYGTVREIIDNENLIIAEGERDWSDFSFVYYKSPFKTEDYLGNTDFVVGPFGSLTSETGAVTFNHLIGSTVNDLNYSSIQLAANVNLDGKQHIIINDRAGNGIGYIDFYTYTNNNNPYVPAARWRAEDLGGFTADQVFSCGPVSGGTPNPPTLVDVLRVTAGSGGTNGQGIGVLSSTITAKVHIGAGSTAAKTAPLKFTSGALMTATEAGANEFLTDLQYMTKTTGPTRAAILAAISGRFTAQTAAKASVVAFTPPSDASFLVSANILVTTATVHSFTTTVTYTDEGNTSRTLTLNFSTIAGAITPTIANAGGAVPYEGVPLHIRAKGGTSITIGTTGTFTTVTYNVEGAITQIA